MAAVVLHTLMPADVLSLGQVIGVFMVAQIAGLISQVPGGLGGSSNRWCWCCSRDACRPLICSAHC